MLANHRQFDRKGGMPPIRAVDFHTVHDLPGNALQTGEHHEYEKRHPAPGKQTDDDGNDVEELLHNADQAMYAAKENGGQQVKAYENRELYSVHIKFRKLLPEKAIVDAERFVRVLEQLMHRERGIVRLNNCVRYLDTIQ